MRAQSGSIISSVQRSRQKNEYNYTQSASYLTGDAAMGSGVTADYRYDSIYSIASHPAGYTCYNLYADGRSAGFTTIQSTIQRMVLSTRYVRPTLPY